MGYWQEARAELDDIGDPTDGIDIEKEMKESIDRDNYFLIRKGDFKHQLVECANMTAHDFDNCWDAMQHGRIDVTACWDALECAFEVYLESKVK